MKSEAQYWREEARKEKARYLTKCGELARVREVYRKLICDLLDPQGAWSEIRRADRVINADQPD